MNRTSYDLKYNMFQWKEIFLLNDSFVSLEETEERKKVESKSPINQKAHLPR